jgi:capsular polysaccharide transport system permease protein
VIPTALAIVYFSLIASDRYISESRFVIRSNKSSSAGSSSLGGLLSGGGGGINLGGFSLGSSNDDAMAVHDYMLSRDALAELEKTLNVKKAFSKFGLDAGVHFPSFTFWDTSFEALYRYYPRRITVEFDPKSSVSVLTVNAFTAQDAYKINETLLEMGERLVNKLNERARQDMIGYAQAVVTQTEKRAKDATLALAAYRNEKGVIDPEKQSAFQLQQIGKLYEDLIAVRTQLTQLTTYTPQNPQIPALRTRLETIQKTIDAETAKVAGGQGSLANKASHYERLALEREFADKQLGLALAALENARNEAQRKMLYLERVAQPNLPDIAIEPRRIHSIFVVFVVGLVSWGILGLLYSSLREHLD